MGVVRTVIDIRTKGEIDYEEMEHLMDSMKKYANGVITELSLDGDEKVTASVHSHVSTERYSCEACSDLSSDEVH